MELRASAAMSLADSLAYPKSKVQTSNRPESCSSLLHRIRNHSSKDRHSESPVAKDLSQVMLLGSPRDQRSEWSHLASVQQMKGETKSFPPEFPLTETRSRQQFVPQQKLN